MKNLLKTLPIVILLGSCQTSDCTNGQQDGNETGIDCGGNCAPCSTTPAPTCNDGIQNGTETGVDCGGSCSPCNTPTSNNQQFQDILGLWYRDYVQYNQSDQVSGELYTATVFQDCKVDLLDDTITYNSSTETALLEGIGTLTACNYPAPVNYSYKEDYLSGAYIEYLTADSMGLSTNDIAINHYKRTDPYTSNTVDIFWEVELQSNHSQSNVLKIEVGNSNIQSSVQTIPIVSGQNYYSGTYTVNLNNSNPRIDLMILPQNISTWNSVPDEVITFNTALYKDNVPIATHTNATYCVGSTTGCQGYQSIAGSPLLPTSITW